MGWEVFAAVKTIFLCADQLRNYNEGMPSYLGLNCVLSSRAIIPIPIKMMYFMDPPFGKISKSDLDFSDKGPSNFRYLILKSHTLSCYNLAFAI